MKASFIAVLLLGVTAGSIAAQVANESLGAASLDSLVARAIAVNPRIRAARERINAARAMVRPAGLMPDPMLSIGIQNLPLGRDEGSADRALPDMMSMKMLGIGQTVPFPGKLSLRRRAADHEAAAAEAGLGATQLDVVREVREAYYAIAFLDRSLEILERNQQVLVNLIRSTESRYAVGSGAQPDVLKARVETARLAEAAVTIVEERRAALARLNALLDRPVDAPVAEPRIPERIAHAAVEASATRVQFTSTVLGARAADSPLPPLGELQATAVRINPELIAHEAMIRAQAARVELARKDHLPDFDLSVSYGQRNRRPDMITAMVSVAIPWQKGNKQEQLAIAANAELSALEAEYHDSVNALHARVASLYAELERARAQLGLFVKAILPQGSASLTSATASFQVGRVDFLTVLESQTTLLEYEIAYHRGLTDFASKLAELEAVVGEEILP